MIGTPCADANAIDELINTNDFRLRYPVLANALSQSVQDIVATSRSGPTDIDSLSATEQLPDVQLQWRPSLNLSSAPQNSGAVPTGREVDDDASNTDHQQPPPHTFCFESEADTREHPSHEGQPASTALRPDKPLNGLSPDHTPGHYVKRLQDIQKAYAHIIGKRHTVEFFHKTLRQHARRQATNQQHIGPVLRSRLELCAEIQRPTASLYEVDEKPVGRQAWDVSKELEGGGLSSFVGYRKGGPELQHVLGTLPPVPEAAPTSLIGRDLILEGVQKMPKPNPAWLFHKNGCDISVAHLADVARLWKEKAHDVERCVQQFHYRKDFEGLAAVGANQNLSELLKSQRELTLAQQQEKEEILDDALLYTLEMDTVVRHVRDDLYNQIFSVCEDPDALRWARDRAKCLVQKVETTAGLREGFHRAETSTNGVRKLQNAGKLRSFSVGEQAVARRPDPAEIAKVLRKAGYSKKPVPVSGYPNLRSRFPGIFKQSKYQDAVTYRFGVGRREQRQAWEAADAPSYKDIRESGGDWTKRTCLREDPKKSELERDRWQMRQQQEKREFEDDWVAFVSQQLALRDRSTPEAHYVAEEAPANCSKAEDAFVAAYPSVQPTADMSGTKKEEGAVLTSASSRDQSRSVMVTRPVQSTGLETRSVAPSPAVTQTAQQTTALPQQETIPSFGRAETIPLINIIINNPPALASRLPRRRCRTFVSIDPWKPSESLQRLYDDVKKGANQGRLGLPDMALTLFDFAKHCQEPEAIHSSRAKEYVNLLTECLPFYPLQLELLSVGLIALLKIYDAFAQKESLVASYADCFTTLMAVDEPGFRTQLIAALSVVIDRPGTVELSTDLVDFLLEKLSAYDDAATAEQGLKILCIGVGLEQWRHEPPVLVRSCLAVDAFAQRGAAEILRGKKRKEYTVSQRSGASSPVLPLKPTLELPAKPLAWMPQDGSDVATIVKVMTMHSSHRKVLGAACTALASLARISVVHCSATVKKGWEHIMEASATHASSQSIALSITALIEVLAMVPSVAPSVANEASVNIVLDIMMGYLTAPPVIAGCCNALVAFGEPLLSASIDLYFSVLRGGSSVFQSDLYASAAYVVLQCRVSTLIAVLCVSKQLVDMQSIFVKLGAVSFEVDVLQECRTETEVVNAACRALARLVYKNAQGGEQLASLSVSATLMMLLVKHKTNLDLALVIINCLKCCISASDACVESLLTGYFEILQQVQQSAKTAKRQDVTKEVLNCLREINKKATKLQGAAILDVLKSTLTQCTELAQG